MKLTSSIDRRTVVRSAALGALALTLGISRDQTAWADIELVVVVNAMADCDPLSDAQLASIFTGTEKTWKNGKAIKVFNLAALSPERALFDKVVLKRTPEQVSQFWVDKLVRGEGHPPTQVPRVELMAKVVATLPGAIGYVTADKADPRSKVIARIRGGKVMAP